MLHDGTDEAVAIAPRAIALPSREARGGRGARRVALPAQSRYPCRTTPGPTAPCPTRVLRWSDTPAAYLDAITAADLTSRVTVEALPHKDTTQAQRADTEAMLAPRPPSRTHGKVPLGAGPDRRRRDLARPV